ncbi:MAG: amino acid racemase [Nanoarchaeota archaeon]
MTKKIIGVLGGMGPESTAIFYHALIIQCQRQYGAKHDHDYPEIFIYNLPIPPIVEGIRNPEKTLKILIKGAKRLESIGVDFIVMPCNTAHYFYDQLRKGVSIPFLSIVEETANKIVSSNYKQVGLLATDATISEQIFKTNFEKRKIQFLVPMNQKIMAGIIMNILSGKILDSDKQMLLNIMNELVERGAEAVVLGCTDLPILIHPEDTAIKLIDTIQVLAESTIRFAVPT